MFGMKKRIEREMMLKARIKELENIICPHEAHDYVKMEETIDSIDASGSACFSVRYVCQRCSKVKCTHE